MLVRATHYSIAHEIAGAARIRHSLRPLNTEGRKLLANLGQIVPREREAMFGNGNRHILPVVTRASATFCPLIRPCVCASPRRRISLRRNMQNETGDQAKRTEDIRSVGVIG